ncbi:ABC transporter ATP-binding protein [Roseibium sp. SCP14]|uniref:ABC transporter ATP-binding protein n=1 Tax=Roseibium sp. SCP14 TaxID=3141375 RepID=UPI00333AEB56
MLQPDVELTGITKHFGSVVAVDNVSFAIPRGDFFSLLGPSGCGKTTIMRMISGFEQPTRGTIEIAGQNMSGKKPYERPTNLVFQHLSLFPHMSVAQNIAFGLEMKRTSRTETDRQVARMLELVHLADYGQRKISQLSGGQKQRVAIARALVNAPAVLLLDEPLGALDLKLREQMQLELKRIQREVGTTFIYVTHDQKEAITMSDKIAVVNHGRIEQMDSAVEIYENPKTAFVANFIGETNLLEGNLSLVNGSAATVSLPGVDIRAALNFKAAKGTGVSLSVRPESLVMGQGATSATNRLNTRIEDIVYLGSMAHYRLVSQEGLRFTAEVTQKAMAELPVRGETVLIGWEPEDGRLFETRQAAA